jgi:hypothetical protein
MFSPGRNEDPPPSRWRTYTRDDLIRVVVSQQWVALVTARILCDDAVDTDGGLEGPAPEDAPELAMWACAVDVVDGDRLA